MDRLQSCNRRTRLHFLGLENQLLLLLLELLEYYYYYYYCYFLFFLCFYEVSGKPSLKFRCDR